jgi:hypothetical protein
MNLNRFLTLACELEPRIFGHFWDCFLKTWVLRCPLLPRFLLGSRATKKKLLVPLFFTTPRGVSSKAPVFSKELAPSQCLGG